ncbi:MAG: ATP-dependent DNA helicase [Acidobacteriota bacterium]|nr:MAG: ATP-dependent DNA helicase [Acidobacteriota bacterium]
MEHCLRSGNLNLESWGPSSSPVDAIRAHQKVQSSRGEGYRKEVTLSHIVENDHFVLEIGGRIDGVLTREPIGTHAVVIEEIKTTSGDLDARTAQPGSFGFAPTHWGQLEVYAYIYALQNDLEEVDGRLTYYQLESGQTRELERHFTIAELGEMFDELVERYLRWAKRIDDRLAERNDSIASTEFPFPAYRPGQRAMAVQVYRAIQERDRLLVRAPTGIGKTQATIFPTIKALGEDRIEKIFYLTARTTGHALAEQAVRELRTSNGGGLRLKSVTLTAKDKICFNPEKACNGDECEFARGFYDRIDAAVEELFTQDEFCRESLETLARVHRVCPFELSLELALWADLIVCDYNYVFDPHAYLRRFFADVGGAYAFLVDESHNLVDRAREMYSAELRKRDVLNLHGLLERGRHRALRQSLNAINRAFLDARERCDSAAAEPEPPEPLYAPLKTFVRHAESFLAAGTGKARGDPAHQALLDLYFDVSRFLHVAERFDERYVTCYEARGRDVRVKLFCTDPSKELSESLDKASSSVFFSATLTPMGYFRTALGCGEDAASYVLPSPFPEEHLRVLVNDRIATTYRKREQTRVTLTRLLTTFVEQKPGNYLLYFPSYEYMNAVSEEFALDVEMLVQRPDMDEAERSAFLESFSDDSTKTLVGFAVMGGFFGEGIDLMGERLTGAAIVGVGLPGLSPERDQIRDHFDRTAGSGFDYAYVFPGMNRVLQAAGRVIRSASDRGTILLVDERFSQARYRNLLPPEWRPVIVANELALRETLTAFWSQNVGVPV